ncbi:MAG TPA: DUF4124 domain-containing protein [Rhodanobacteraceae bacterium]|nr:DUF4124 domain-containing protein [Rhodanobacteraceae bacterium]
MQRVIVIFAVLAGVGWGASAHAQVYRCVTAEGAVSFQDHACGAGQAQKVIDLPSRAPPGYVPPPPATAASPVAPAVSAPVPPAPAAPATPLPVLYACVGAVNGKPYLTRSPPPPYLAPLGVLGYPPESLAQAYGGPRGAGASAPELAHPRLGGPRIAAGMTEVQDACRPAPKVQVCAWVQKAYQENHRRLRMAMPHAAPPFEAREQRLTAELANC